MKASVIYKLNDQVGPMKSKVTVIKESDMGRYGVFLVEVCSMSNSLKSYGKIKKSYEVAVWEYDLNGELQEICTSYYASKKDALKDYSNVKI